jgi:Abortive infection C-terminus
MHETDLPTDPSERALALQELLVSHATGGRENDTIYRLLRREFMERTDTCELLPAFVRTCRTLGTFWGWIKAQSPHWEPRRVAIRNAFTPLLDYLEGRKAAPSDKAISEALESFDEAGVHKAWAKALGRRGSDADGAITAARTLLETVCKRILDENQKVYVETEDLPRLYHAAAETLSLAPSQHTEQLFKAILGSCQSVVNGLGTLRNKIGDAHGKGGRPVKPSARHAALAVNLAGAMATFLVETHNERKA